jgi:PAS domain S-box-containing protein
MDLTWTAGDTCPLSLFRREKSRDGDIDGNKTCGFSGGMDVTDFQLRFVGDLRLAPHATSALPAWLWSTDGAQVLWANPVAARQLGAANAVDLARRAFGPADAHRRQVTQLAARLPQNGAARLERLRGFGASLGQLVTCACMRLVFADGDHAILIAATEPAGRTLPLLERLRLLVEGLEKPVAAFASDGMLTGASEAARALSLRDLPETARTDALDKGRAELAIDGGHMLLHRVGRGDDAGIIALVTPHAATSDTPAGIELVDVFKEPLDEATPVQAIAEPPQEPSPYVEAVADEPETVEASERALAAPRRPLRFTWQMDEENRFFLGSDEFTRLIGTRTAVGFGRPWHEIAETFGLDPAGRVSEAIATRNTWSGITVYWPVDDGGRLPVELSGLPVYDNERNFAGYRGFGVCRDLDSLAHLAELRRARSSADESSSLPPDNLPAQSLHAVAAQPPADDAVMPPSAAPASTENETSPSTDLDTPVETPQNVVPQNVVPFRPLGDARPPVLTPVENNAFDELARQLSARLENGQTREAPVTDEVKDQPVEPAAPAATEASRETPPAPEWLEEPEPPARGEAQRDRTLLDLLPTGILIYRLDRLLYANPAFLKRIGYDSLHALEQAGGLDALYVEAGVSSASSTSEAGKPVTISASHDAAGQTNSARLFTISWDGESALALMFTPEAPPAPVEEAKVPATEPPAIATEPVAGQVMAEDLAAILDTTAEGIVMFDAEGNIHACNRSAEALFGYDGNEFVRHNLTDLFAPESRRGILEYLESVKGTGVASLLDHGRDVLGRVSHGGIIPLSATMGRTRPGGPNFFAVFRDMSHVKKGESELQQAQRLADRAAGAKTDMLARISHEVRVPLNAIIGFAEVMIGERFGSLGNERYVEYMKDIRASGERVLAILNDLAELTRIETGKLDLAFANQNLNELVESCVTAMQPQANRERKIIRTSLAQALPPVVADARALRQITLNLIGNSIHLANPAGQVIVSTALSDLGDVVLRVRDTGQGLNDNEVAAAMEPFRTPPPSDNASDGSPVSLSLTKALVEANRAKFAIRTGGRSGTLIEVVFPNVLAQA